MCDFQYFASNYIDRQIVSVDSDLDLLEIQNFLLDWDTLLPVPLNSDPDP